MITLFLKNQNILNYELFFVFRYFLSFFISFFLSVFIGKYLISYLKNIVKKSQPIRQIGPETHLSKIGTPTMGGLMIIFSSLLTITLTSDLLNFIIYPILVVMIGYCILGFIDDYQKIQKNNHYGISARQKLFFQIIIAFFAHVLLVINSHSESYFYVYLPFSSEMKIYIGYFSFLWGIFVIIGSSNAVNLTDGLDGLVSVPLTVVLLCFGILSIFLSNSSLANLFKFSYNEEFKEIANICFIMIGSILGFLWYNSRPAEIFMGDTGSLSLGGMIGILSLTIHSEIILAIIGMIFVIETLSVMVQVIYFKRTNGKRFFRMAPIHHHFEKCGLDESKVVIRFWIVSILFAFLGIFLISLRLL